MSIQVVHRFEQSDTTNPTRNKFGEPQNKLITNLPAEHFCNMLDGPICHVLYCNMYLFTSRAGKPLSNSSCQPLTK